MPTRIDWRGLAITALAVLLAFVVRLTLRPLLGDASPFLLFAPAVMIAAFAAGPLAGAAATLASAMLGTHFFLIGISEPTVERWDRIALFLLVGALITVLSSISERSQQKLRASLDREQRARLDAEMANRVKDRFLAVVSHELQTPASVILGWVSNIRTRHLTGDALDHALAAIERNARLHSRLVADVLDSARVANRSLRIELQRTPLADIVGAAVEQVRPTIETRGLELSVDLGDPDVTVDVDPVRIQQVVVNLLTNAAKFTPQGGHVSVLLTTSATHAIMEVADTGVGIRADFLPRIFDQFEQDARTLGYSRQGLGLGLSIARHLVEAHGGTLSAASEGPGHGATFTMLLPLRAGDRSAVTDPGNWPGHPPAPVVH